MDDPPYPLVHVVWRDSAHNRYGWDDLADVTTRVVIAVSVGWLTYDDGECITITPHIGTHGAGHQGCGDMTIPRSAIVAIRAITIHMEPS